MEMAAVCRFQRAGQTIGQNLFATAEPEWAARLWPVIVYRTPNPVPAEPIRFDPIRPDREQVLAAAGPDLRLAGEILKEAAANKRYVTLI